MKPLFQKHTFTPCIGLRSAHTQTILPIFLSVGEEPPSVPHSFDIGEGDFLVGAVSTPPSWREKDPTVVLLHGLGGSHRSIYMIRLARRFYAMGIRTVRLDFRGCGLGEGKSKKTYNSGNSQDIIQVIKALKEASPATPITLIGFSLGGNTAIKLAGEWGEEGAQYIDHLMAFCPTLDLYEAVVKIDEPRHWIYRRYYLRNLMKQCRQWKVNPAIRSIYEFDEKVTAPFWGYKDAMDYYAKCSSYQFIPSIRVKTDILLSGDDPFISETPLEKISTPPNVHLHITRYGGHLGFISTLADGEKRFWMDNFIVNQIGKPPHEKH